MVKESRKDRLNKLDKSLVDDRSSFISHWKELGEYILPRRGRFFVTDTNKGDRRNKKIIDSTATLAARTLRSGMMSGMTSPARPWFRLSIGDGELAQVASVKEWLSKVSQLMLDTFVKSNIYNVLPIAYGDIGVFATSAIFIEENEEKVFRAHAFPIGSYKIANDAEGRVAVFSRDFQMSVRQVIEKFAIHKDGKIIFDNISDTVKDKWETGNREDKVTIRHVIKPNDQYDKSKLESKYKKYMSNYWEVSSKSEKKKDIFLREKGYDYFPVLVPRWEVTGEDSWGTDCPGMAALGDIKQLQAGEKTAAKGIQKQVDPSMVGSTELKKTTASLLPGDITYVDEQKGSQGFRPAHEVNLNLASLENKQEQVRQRIRKAFFEDLFLMLSTSDRRQITAREITERHEEKLLALGPVLEQLNQDLLDPLIDIVFDFLLKQGKLPEAPEELQGFDLKVEYISIMAQAQKLVGLGAIEKFTGFVGQVANYNPEVLHKIDTDSLVDIYGDITSVPEGIIRSKEDVEQMRGEIATAQEQQAQQQASREAVASMKDLSQTTTEEGSALSALLEGQGGLSE